MAIENGDQSVRWAGASGSAPGGTALAAGTPFFIASIDKLLNATIVLKLSETGHLNLDTTICSYLPRTLTQGLHRLDGLDSSERITVRHLLGAHIGAARLAGRSTEGWSPSRRSNLE
jgi:CubicO group peptidase (beta-lactamase class C family)